MEDTSSVENFLKFFVSYDRLQHPFYKNCAILMQIGKKWQKGVVAVRILTPIKESVTKTLVKKPKKPKEPKETKEPKTSKKPKKTNLPKPSKKQLLLQICKGLLTFCLAFFLSRTSLLYGITPFGGSAFLAMGGGLFPYFGAILGSYTLGGYDTMVALTLCFLFKRLISGEKWDALQLFVSFGGVFAVVLLTTDPLPRDAILKVISVILTVSGYYILKKAYRAQFVKAPQLKFTRDETYCSLFLLFALVSGIRSETVVSLVRFHDVLTFFIIVRSAYSFGIGGGAAAGALLGILSGRPAEFATLSMSVYSLFGFFTGIFSKFNKFVAFLGFLFSYVFVAAYFPQTENLVYYYDILIAGLLFLCVPDGLLEPYLDRYREGTPVADRLASQNAITADRLDRLAKSFSGLSVEIGHHETKLQRASAVSEQTLYDYVEDKLCHGCSLKRACWQEHRSDTVEGLTAGMNRLAKSGTLSLKYLPDAFRNRCVREDKLTETLCNFFELSRLNAFWKHKLRENTNAFREQFLELSDIICQLKKNMETNRYFDAPLSAELYSALGNAGYLVREVSVFHSIEEQYLVKLEITPCKYRENCFPVIEKIATELLGVPMSVTEGTCGRRCCNLLLCEGDLGNVQQRIQSFSKQEGDASGDSHIISRLSRHRYLVALSDGMGTGKDAGEVSASVVTLLDEMLRAGFSERAAFSMLNSFLLASSSASATLDFAIVDLKKMTATLVKTGASPTYLKREDEVISVEDGSLPAGIRFKKPYVKTLHLCYGDILIWVSDGVAEALPEEDWVYGALRKYPSSQLSETVDYLASVAYEAGRDNPDDMTVLGLKILP